MKLDKGPGTFAATVGISAVVTAGFGWLEVLLGWCIAGILRWLLPREKSGQYNIICMWGVFLLGIFLIGGIVVAAEKAFPEDGTFPFVSLGLLLLLYRSLIGEKDTGNMVSNVLGLMLLGLMGAVLLFGFSNVAWGELYPETFRWKRVWITAAIASPWWTEKGEQKWGWFSVSALVCVGMSILCRGILGAALTEYSGLPLYQAVQTIRILGILQRFEALLAAAVLLGTFAMLTKVGSIIRNAAETIMPKVQNRKWAAVVILLAYLMEYLYLNLDQTWQEGISTVFWGMIPFFALGIVFSKKVEKRLDK